MEMCRLPTAHQGQRHVLPCLWSTLGRLCRYRVCGSSCDGASTCADSDPAHLLPQLRSRRHSVGWMALSQFVKCKSEETATEAEVAEASTRRWQRKQRQRQGQGRQEYEPWNGTGRNGTTSTATNAAADRLCRLMDAFCNSIPGFWWTSTRSSHERPFASRGQAEGGPWEFSRRTRWSFLQR